MENVQTSETQLFDLIQRMAILAEFRDPGIGSHITRMRGYCRTLAAGLDLAAEEVRRLEAASMLHDVGKASVPHHVLQKTGRLTEEEWEIVKEHTRVGADFLAGSPLPVMQQAQEIARTHHERWDGSGYPQGLQREEIPLPGRICAIADVFDALTTRRPYKKEVSVEEALDLLRSAAGSLFDPRVVQVFARDFERLCAIRAENL